MWRRAAIAIGLAGTGTVAAAQDGAGEPTGWARHGYCATTPRATEGAFGGPAWPGGVVPFRFVTSGSFAVTGAQQQAMAAVMQTLSGVCAVQFVPWSGQANVLEIRTNNNTSCGSSSVSCMGMCGGVQLATICVHDWPFPGILHHELLHVLGLMHEHQRADRGPFIQIHPQMAGDAQYAVLNGTTHGPYDFASVMHYDQVGLVNGNAVRAIRVLEPYTRAWQYELDTSMFVDAYPSAGDIWALQSRYGGTALPRPFALVSPARHAAVGSAWAPLFSWAVSEEAASYRLEVDQTPLFDSPEIDIVTAGTSYGHAGLLEARRLYWWRVTAQNGAGSVAAYPFRALAFYTDSAYPAGVYVDDSAPPGGDGSGWATPLRDLAVAVETAYASGGATATVFVGQGVYTPDFGSGDRALSLWLPHGCAVLGGFAGYGAAEPGARDIEAFATVLSGDLNGDDGPGFTNRADNSRTIVMSLSNPAGTLLEGFTVRGGRANPIGNFPGLGAAVLVDGGAPTIRRCRFTGNEAELGGAGVFVHWDGVPTIEGCVFEGNRVAGTGFELGGAGLHAMSTGSFAVTGCVFTGNVSTGGGAAAAAQFAHPRFTNCLFAANAASGPFGGALLSRTGGQPRVVNCTFSGNTSAAPGGAVHASSGSPVTIANSIIWGNTPDQLFGPTTVGSSAVQGIAGGSGNTGQDPRFAPGGYRLSPSSPCIDAGHNPQVPAGVMTDLDGLARFHDDPGVPNSGIAGPPGGSAVVDMGAYEFRGASCYADCNIDGQLTVSDFGCFQTRFVGGGPYADCNGDGVLTVADFGCFQTTFVAGCP